MKDFAFGKSNFIWVGVSVFLIIVGFALMSGGGSKDGISFNPERIVIAPIVTMVGFILMVFAILKGDKKTAEHKDETLGE